MSYTLQIRDAIAAHVTATVALLSTEAAVAVGFAPPVHTLAELDTLRIDVVPLGVETELATRGALDHAVSVDIGFAKRLTNASPTETDLIDLVERVNDSLRELRITGAAFVSTTIETLADEEDYRVRKVWRSLITATFQVRT